MSDPFLHLPNLRGLLKPAHESDLRVTTEVLAMWDERARQLKRPPNWRLTNEQLTETRQALLGDFAEPRDLWIYAYGSLMWDPGIHFAEVRLARLHGYERRFNYKTTVGRGSPDHPALLLSIDRNPRSCEGLAFRLAANVADEESSILWRREMVRGNYVPAILPMSTPQGDIEALVFTADPANVEYCGEFSLKETASITRTGSGPLGTNIEYLEQLSRQLAAMNILDPYVHQLISAINGSDEN